MVEVIRWGISYLMVGVIVQMSLQGLAKMLESPKLDIREGVTTILVWPLALLLFMWFFVKGYLENREK